MLTKLGELIGSKLVEFIFVCFLPLCLMFTLKKDEFIVNFTDKVDWRTICKCQGWLWISFIDLINLSVNFSGVYKENMNVCIGTGSQNNFLYIACTA